MSFLFWLAVITAVLYTVVALDVFIGNRSVGALRDVPGSPPPDAPLVSIITAARNEERNIREGLRSLLAVDYPNLEFILVNDRSEDATGAILDEMAAQAPHLNVVHVSELPPGWLGKNHALWLGARKAQGEIFLFADADVVMEPTVISRAVRFLLQNRLDHLAVTPRLTMPGTFLSMFGLSFILFFAMYARPWKARDPKSRYHIGIGAFNMVRTAAYWAVGGHERIRLRPDDDMKLGKIVKKGGYRSDGAYGPEFISVEWYSSVGEVIRGLEKNAFAGCDYSLALVLAGVVLQLVGCIFPFLALVVTTGATRAIYAGVVLLLTLLVADCARFHGSRPWHAIGFAPCAVLMCWIIIRTTTLNIVHGGITWRGTFYSLKDLKKNGV
jgi:cellulose synthase/poly-beta-1,6-N-acetylglucosamine synthase-like glycosyltransferase